MAAASFLKSDEIELLFSTFGTRTINWEFEMLKYDRVKLAKETEDSLTKEFVNDFGIEPEYEPDFEDFIDPEEFEGPAPEDIIDL